MSELGRRLERLPMPDDGAAERVGRSLSTAFAERPPARRRGRRRAVTVPAIAFALLATSAAGLAATGHGGPIGRWLRSLVDPVPAAHPLGRLPATGRLLAVNRHGVWIVDAGGDRHDLGRWTDASWSPHGLFVATVRGPQLAAVDPHGAVRWQLVGRGAVGLPRWSPDGFRIAYRSGRALRVVAGDGSGDRLISAATAAVAPAWRPGGGHMLAYATTGGAIRVAPVDRTGSRRVATARAVTWLGWSERRLVVATRRGLRFVGSRGGWTVPDGLRLRAVATAPHGGALAVLAVGHGTTSVIVVGRHAARTLLVLRGSSRTLTWSPDGRWLLTAHRGRWVLVPLARGRPRAIGGLGHALLAPAGTATPRGWCCVARLPLSPSTA